MDDIFEIIAENPIAFFALIGIVLFVLTKFLSAGKKANAQAGASNNKNSGATSFVNNPVGFIEDELFLGDKPRIEKEHGWYRNQPDNQPIIERSEEQQRIVDEYFKVKNYKVTTCDPNMKKYQKYLNWGFIGALVAAVISICIGGANDDMETFGIVALVFVLAAIGLKIASGYFKKKFKESIKHTVAPKKLMTDAEYEALVAKKIEDMNIADLGLERLGLDRDQVKEINPIVITDKVIKKHSFTVRNKDDKSVHSSTQHVTYLYFTDEQLFVYKIQFDMCCNVQEEWASEFFYKDICDVSSYTSRNIIKLDDFQFEYSTISFNIIASNSQIGFDLAGDSDRVASIQGMKQKIREKKAQ